MESSTLRQGRSSPEIAEAAVTVSQTPDSERRFADLRGVQWRINLGILPSSTSSSIDDLRRVTADCRRRYASLRRRLLVDLHILKDGSNSPSVLDNPLSQNPDSMWGRFFRNAELEKMVDQDLSRLYPEHGSYFQTPGCQGMLRRILLLWCLRHQEYGYRQGMHELLAPLLYVLHVDLNRLSQVQKLYEDHFTDKFDGLAFEESDLTYNFDFKKFSDSMDDGVHAHGISIKASTLDELSPEIQTIVLLSDSYGAEGELGILLSEKFMEHDAYCMFDALMSGSRGAVAMADFFSPSPSGGSHTGLPPVIEASSALYHLLSIVDSSLYSHLVELGVEPQYFALRWLRVLFGREFSLESLLIIWDEIFTSDNVKSDHYSEDNGFTILSSARGTFISALAVSMILQMRASLFATENATSCLQRLLNFPQNVNLKKLIEKAKSLQSLALDTRFNGSYNRSKPMNVRGHSNSMESISPTTPLSLVPDSYWEEKWRDMHKADESKEGNLGQYAPSRKKRWSEKVRLTLSRSESDPSHKKVENSKKNPKLSVRRSLLEDLSKELGLEEENIKKTCSNETIEQKDPIFDEIKEDGQNRIHEPSTSGNTVSEENSSSFSPSTSTNNDQENDLEKSSVASNSSIEYNNEDELNNTESFRNIQEDQSLPISDPPELSEDLSIQSIPKKESAESLNPATDLKERKPLLAKFQWFWKFGRNGDANKEETSEKGGSSGGPAATKGGNGGSNIKDCSTGDVCGNSCTGDKGGDKNVMVSLRNLGQSMLENVQVIESVFQQERGQTENISRNHLIGKGQVTAMAALKELRKISNILSEM